MPAEQFVQKVEPVTEENLPGEQYPEHNAVVRPLLAPYVPVEQLVQAVDPATENCPKVQYPEQLSDDSPVVAPYLPEGQFRHKLAPAVLNWPVAHIVHANDVVALVVLE